jgi:hypothetical protein
MDLITIRLADLGEGCIVTNAQGKAFLDLSKCPRTIGIGYKDGWELRFTTRATKSETHTGKRVVAPQMVQTEEEKAGKVDAPYIGSGIRLFDDTNTTVKPNVRPANTDAKVAAKPMPSAQGDDLPW